MAVGFFFLGLGAWLGSVLLPPMLAFIFWRIGKKQWGWVAHLLFLPGVMAIEYGLVWLLFFAAHDNGDGPPGLGLALIHPLMVLIASVIGYYECIAYTMVRWLWRHYKNSESKG